MTLKRVSKRYQRCSSLVVVVDLAVIRFSIRQGSVVSQPIVLKLFTRINDNILHQATVADF